MFGTRYFNRQRELTPSGIDRYAQAILDDEVEKLPNRVLEHVDAHPALRAQIVSRSVALQQWGTFPAEGMTRTTAKKGTRFSSGQRTWLWGAGGLVLTGVLGLVVWGLFQEPPPRVSHTPQADHARQTTEAADAGQASDDQPVSVQAEPSQGHASAPAEPIRSAEQLEKAVPAAGEQSLQPAGTPPLLSRKLHVQDAGHSGPVPGPQPLAPLRNADRRTRGLVRGAASAYPYQQVRQSLDQLAGNVGYLQTLSGLTSLPLMQATPDIGQQEMAQWLVVQNTLDLQSARVEANPESAEQNPPDASAPEASGPGIPRDPEIREPQPLNLVKVKSRIDLPRDVIEQGISGDVVLKVLVNARGRIDDYVVLDSPHPDITKAVTKKLHKARFEPARRNGVPIKRWFITKFLIAPPQSSSPQPGK